MQRELVLVEVSENVGSGPSAQRPGDSAAEAFAVVDWSVHRDDHLAPSALSGAEPDEFESDSALREDASHGRDDAKLVGLVVTEALSSRLDESAEGVDAARDLDIQAKLRREFAYDTLALRELEAGVVPDHQWPAVLRDDVTHRHAILPAGHADGRRFAEPLERLLDDAMGVVNRPLIRSPVRCSVQLVL